MNHQLSKKIMAFFLTRGMSLEKWDRLGMLSREVTYYSALANSFGELVICSYGTKNDLQYKKLFPENVTILTRPRYLPSFAYSFLLPLFHRNTIKKAHVLKTNQMDGSWTAVIAKKLFNIKLVVRCGYEWHRFIMLANRSWYKRWFAFLSSAVAYKNADGIIITSETDKKHIMDTFHIPDNHISVFRNFIDTELFAPAETAKIPGRIIFVGRLEEQKNAVNLFSALVGLPVHLVIIGNGGSLKNQLEQFASDHQMNVEFKGSLPQKDIVGELQKSELFAMPSIYEGSPKALFEAMATGLACIGGNNAETKEVIVHGENGMIAGPDADSIQTALQTLVNNASLRASLGAKARETIVKECSFGTIINKELALHEQIINA